MADAIHISLDQLRQMIGVRVRSEGLLWHVVEVLEDGPSLVLESLRERKVVQGDQFGEGRRWAPDHLTVPVLSPDRTELHPRFLELELVE